MSKCIHGVSLRKTCGDCLNDACAAEQRGFIRGLAFMINARAERLTMCDCNQGRLPCTCKPAPDDTKALRDALRLTVASLDQLLPHLGKVPADVGLLNDALCAARPLLAGK